MAVDGRQAITLDAGEFLKTLFALSHRATWSRRLKAFLYDFLTPFDGGPFAGDHRFVFELIERWSLRTTYDDYQHNQDYDIYPSSQHRHVFKLSWVIRTESSNTNDLIQAVSSEA